MQCQPLLLVDDPDPGHSHPGREDDFHLGRFGVTYLVIMLTKANIALGCIIKRLGVDGAVLPKAVSSNILTDDIPQESQG